MLISVINNHAFCNGTYLSSSSLGGLDCVEISLQRAQSSRVYKSDKSNIRPKLDLLLVLLSVKWQRPLTKGKFAMVIEVLFRCFFFFSCKYSHQLGFLFKPRLHVLTLLYNICWFSNVRTCSRHVRWRLSNIFC